MSVLLDWPIKTDSPLGGHSDGPLWYLIYGLRVRSDVRLPIASTRLPDGATPDLEVRLAEPGRRAPEPDGPIVASTPCAIHGTDMRVYRGPSGAWIWHRAVGTFHVSPDARRVEIYTEGEVDERVLGLILAGPISVFVLHQLGHPTLHASAVMTEHGVVAFLGPKGKGKSTMAASFLRRGATLVTDDVLQVRLAEEEVCAVPSLPLMKVWSQTAECTLEITDDLPNLVANYAKKLLSINGRYSFADKPARVAALYVLDRYEPDASGTGECVIKPIGLRDALTTILGQMSEGAHLQPAEVGRFLPLYARLVRQAPVRILRYPTGFAYQETVCRRILEDVGGDTHR